MAQCVSSFEVIEDRPLELAGYCFSFTVPPDQAAIRHQDFMEQVRNSTSYTFYKGGSTLYFER